MKKFTLIILATILSQITFSQKAKYIKAKIALTNRNLIEAMENIEIAITSPEIKDDAKAWQTRGEIYEKILFSTDEELMKIEDASLKSFESYQMSNKIDTRESNKTKNNTKIQIIQNLALNKGVQNYNNKQYNSAISEFHTANDIAKYFSKVDSQAIYNLALSHENLKNYDEAIIYYKKSIEIDFFGEESCSSIYYIYSSQGESIKLKEHLTSCRKKYPNDYSLLLSEINFALSQGDMDLATINVNKAIEIEPTNKVLHFTKGSIIQKENPKLAETVYLKAIDIDPNYFDALYNLGALYYNNGVELINKSNVEVDNDKYAEYKKLANREFEKATKYLEITHKINPNDKNTITSLKQLYLMNGEIDKLKEIEEKLK